MVFFRIIISLVVMALCVLLMKYSVQVTEFTGKLELAEKYLTGTYTFYKLFGLLIMILMLVWMFGGFDFLPLS